MRLFTLIFFALTLFFNLLYAELGVNKSKMVGRLFNPVGTVTVMHKGKNYKVFNRFKIYRDDIIYLDDKNASVSLILYTNGSVLYNLKGKRILSVKQFLFLQNKPITSRKTNIQMKNKELKPYSTDNVQRRKVFISDD